MALNFHKGKIAAAYKSKVCSFHSELLTPEPLLPEIASFWIESPKLGITLGVEMAQSRKHNAWNEVMGLVLLGAGTVLFLALISYTPKDVPSWVWFSSVSPPNNPAQNFIGPTGAIVAGFMYLTLGAASYLVATILLGFGGAKLFLAGFRIIKRLPWAVTFI